MWEDSEDIESIFVEGASMRALKEAGKFLYEGSQKPSEECVEILSQLGITASVSFNDWNISYLIISLEHSLYIGP